MENKAILDYTLVPSGLAMMLAYHIWLLHRVLTHPTRTVIGVNAINRRFWVLSMMENAPKNGILPVQTLRNNIMASTLLASTAIMLSSLIALLMTGYGGMGGSAVKFVYGDRSEFGVSVKFFSILICFLVAFLLTVQSIRYYSHASILVNVPLKDSKFSLLGQRCRSHNHDHRHHQHITADYVAMCVNRGSYFWSLGLRAFYFSFPLFFWIFGPIPMFSCCFVLVCVFYSLDAVSEPANISDDDHCDGDNKIVPQEQDVELGLRDPNSSQL